MDRRLFLSFLAGTALVWLGPTTVHAEEIKGTLTYTLFSGFERLKDVDFTYDGAGGFTLGTKRVIATTANGLGGADGLAFDPNDGHILVGGQAPIVYKVNPTGPVVTAASTGGPAAFHLAVDPGEAVVWASGIPGTVSRVPIGAAFGTPGTPFPITGNDTVLTSLLFTPDGTVFYTASGAGGFGNFGILTLGPSSGSTVRLLSGVPAAHGGTYDPFTGDILIFGDNHITQIDPATRMIVSDLDLASRGLSMTLDQGTVDGLGHAYVASNTGHLVFLDYSQTGLVGASSNFLTAPFLDSFLDDIAPLVGPGSGPEVQQEVPEPASLLAWSVLGLLGVRLFRRRRT